MAENDIKAWHRLRGDETKVAFWKLEICQNALHKKRSSKKVKLPNVGLRGETTFSLLRAYAITTRVCGINVNNCGMKKLYILTSLSMAISSTI